MRTRLSTWLLPVGCITIALLTVAACEDDETQGASVTFDASSPSFEAGASDVVVPPAPEAGADAAPSMVTISLVDRTAKPLAGVTVVFGNPAGDVIGSAVSSAAGTASFAAPSGSQVTVLFGTPTDRRLLTIVGVEKDDALVAVDIVRGGSDPPASTISVSSLPPNDPVAMYYRLRAGNCETGSSLPLNVSMSPDCFGPGTTVPVIVEALDNGFQPVGFTTAKGVSVPTDGGTLVPALGAWSTTYSTQTVFAFGDAGATPSLSLSEITNGVGQPLFETSSFLDGGTHTAVFPGHPGFPEAIQAEVQFRPNAGSQVRGTAVRANAPGGNATTMVDFSNQLPAITGTSIDEVVGRPSVSWVSTAPLTAADGTYVYLRWTEEGGTMTRSWTFLLPPSATSVVAPALPVGTIGAPTATAVYDTPVRMMAVEASFVSGYAELRKAGAALAPSNNFLDDNGDDFAPPLPKNGTVRYTAFTENGD